MHWKGTWQIEINLVLTSPLTLFLFAGMLVGQFIIFVKVMYEKTGFTT